MRKRTALLVAGAAMWTANLAAQQTPQALVITAENMMAGDEQHQALAERGKDPASLLPGDVVLYQLVFTNITEAAVRDVKFTDPVPAGLQYVGGSAGGEHADLLIEYSVDGGVTFSTQPMIEQIVDGEVVRLPAQPDRYTHIRWQVQGWVPPGANVVAAFRAKLPVAARSGQAQQPGQ